MQIDCTGVKCTFFHGHGGGQMVALPHRGIPFHGHPPLPFILTIPAIPTSRIPSIPVIPAKRRAFPRARRRRRGSPPYQTVAYLPTGTLAEHPPSPRLRRTRTLGPPAVACLSTGISARTEPRPPARLSTGTTVAKGLAALPNHGAPSTGTSSGQSLFFSYFRCQVPENASRPFDILGKEFIIH